MTGVLDFLAGLVTGFVGGAIFGCGIGTLLTLEYLHSKGKFTWKRNGS